MQDAHREERIRDLMARRLGWKPDDVLIPDLPPFDITKANIHDSKKEVLLERDTVRAVVDHIGEIIPSLFEHKEDATKEHTDTAMPGFPVRSRVRCGILLLNHRACLRRAIVAYLEMGTTGSATLQQL